MKKTLLILTALASLTIANAQAGQGETGRYQLVAGGVDRSGKQTVFKIDTVTGQVWMYDSSYSAWAESK